jgi:hypothetical protein
MTITCETQRIFLDTIAGLVERGLGFEADAFNYTIKLTGAH